MKLHKIKRGTVYTLDDFITAQAGDAAETQPRYDRDVCTRVRVHHGAGPEMAAEMAARSS